MNEWICTEDLLPDPDAVVKVLNAYKGTIRTGFLSCLSYGTFWNISSKLYSFEEFTHWLPKDMYKKENERA